MFAKRLPLDLPRQPEAAQQEGPAGRSKSGPGLDPVSRCLHQCSVPAVRVEQVGVVSRTRCGSLCFPACAQASGTRWQP